MPVTSATQATGATAAARALRITDSPPLVPDVPDDLCRRRPADAVAPSLGEDGRGHECQPRHLTPGSGHSRPVPTHVIRGGLEAQGEPGVGLPVVAALEVDLRDPAPLAVVGHGE